MHAHIGCFFLLYLPPPDFLLNTSPGSTQQSQKTVHFTLTEDDGTTTAYETGAVRATTLSWDQATSTLSWSVSGSPEVAGGFTQLQVNLFTPNGVVQSNTVTIGQKGSVVVT